MIVYIFAAHVKQGKTTRLEKWCSSRQGLAGILSPVIEGRRVFRSISNNAPRMMEADASEENVMHVGSFIFSKDAFNWAVNELRNAVSAGAEMIIIDEIGPLELRGEGFHEVLIEILQSGIKKLLIVVREEKLEEVLARYELNRFTVKIISDLQGEMLG